ncbi:MAG: asparagine synthase, partial [Gammaproteobacteria bacterium]|nr:asparagine synthase [Gammaproteobacteria bacterium]
RLEREGYFRPGPIRKAWEDHLACKRQRHYYLWDVLIFQAWLEKEAG